MNDRERAIVMAYTGVCMLTGDRLNEFYKYLAELYGRPVYTHEIAELDIRDRAYKDFLALCKETAPSAEKTELVRCKDCKHWNGETHGCTRNPSVEPWFESDYCNYGARMVE